MTATETLLGQALARGYCHKKNRDKVLDSDLISAMIEELMKLEVRVYE